MGEVIILAVGLMGALLYLDMVSENRRTRPERVRKRLQALGLSESEIDHALDSNTHS